MSDLSGSPERLSVLRIVREFTPHTGGAVTHILELARMIDPFLDDQVIFAPHAPDSLVDDQNFPVDIVRANRPLPCRVSFPIIDDFFYSRDISERLKSLITERDINIIHFHAPILASNIIPHLRRWNSDLKFVVMAHGWPGRMFRRFGFSSTLGKLLIASTRPDHYLILEDGSQVSELQDILDQNSISWTSVYHGIDTTLYRPHATIDANDAFIILFPHRPVSIKSPDLAITIFKKLLALINAPSVSLEILAVDASDAFTLVNIPSDISDHILLPGILDQTAMVDHINNSSIVIGTSLNSNMGRAIQESMACGKPVVVFNNGGISKLITDGKNGMLIEPGNIDEFVNVLQKLYYNPDLRSSIGTCARETIKKERSWEKRIEIELSVYRKLLE